MSDRILLALALAVPASAWSLAPAAAGQTGSKLTGHDTTGGDDFGCDVAVDGDVFVVGARYDSSSVSREGSAYVFRHSGSPGGQWVEEALLTASDGQPENRFGRAVEVQGDMIAIGAQWANGVQTDTGAVYIFGWDGLNWLELGKVVAADGANADHYGHRVILHDDLLVVGANRDDDKGAESGSVYVYRWDGSWFAEEAKLTASDGVAGDFFGVDLDLATDWILVGASRDYNDCGGPGKAYLFKHEGGLWTEEAVLMASDGANCDEFGAAVALIDNIAVIGSRRDNGTGAAYIYVRQGPYWIEEQKLIADQQVHEAWFGAAVSASADRIVVGAPFDHSSAGTNTGKAYVFRRKPAGWALHSLLEPSSPRGRAKYGHFADMDGRTVVIGSPWDGEAGNRAGAAYAYRGGTCQVYGSGWPGTYGTPLLMGSGDLGPGDTVDLYLGNSSAQDTSAYLFAGLEAVELPTNLGGTLLVDPFVIIGLALPADGLNFLVDVPLDGSWDGLTLCLQGLEIDPGASEGFSFTRAFRMDLWGL